MTTNLLSGILFLAVGIFFTIGSTQYAIGDALQMGPGYFPYALGILLSVIGLAILIQSFFQHKDDIVDSWAWRPLLFIIGGNLLFGVLLGGLGIIPPMGFVLAIYGTTILVSGANESFRLAEALKLATVLSILCYVTFVWLLAMPIQVWPSF